MESANNRSDNPYTQLEGYRVYDAPSDVLKYVLVGGRIVPAEQIEVHVEDQSVSVPYDAKTIESAPHIAHFSGAFDQAVHEHYR